ncbi:MAG: carbohydrate kinase [Candidatus Pacebacteria bacterium]|nr:carbohydrate kinase [Candidatus Paceibacterota bacterium]
MAAKAKPIIVGLGEVLWDMLPSGKQLGGAPANFTYHAHALGGRGILVSRVGTDSLGTEILARLNRLGVDCRTVSRDPDHPTGTVEVTLDTQGHPEYIIHEDVAWDYIPYTHSLGDLAARTDAVCFGTLCSRTHVSRSTVLRFLQETHPECLRIYDVNVRQSFYSHDLIDTLLNSASVVKLNHDELPIVASLTECSRGDDTATIAALMSKYDLTAFAMTRGAHGSLLQVGNHRADHPGISGDVQDTVGAGDSFTAALASGLLRGDHPETINEHANRVAAYVVSQTGATPPLPAELID